MGNQQEKESGNEISTNEESNDSPQYRKLSMTFEKIAGPGAIVNVQQFQEKLFPWHRLYGEYIYSAMRKEPGSQESNNDALTKEQYISAGQNLMQLLTLSEQMSLYFKIFSKWKEEMNPNEFMELFEVCYTISWSSTGLSPPNIAGSNDEFLIAAKKSLFGSDEKISCGDLTAWCGRQCPQILQKLHSTTTAALCGNIHNPNEAAGSSSDARLLVEEKLSLKPVPVCLLSYLLPMSYIPATDSISGDPLSAIQTISQLDDIVAASGWSLLYDSHAQGLSVSRFQHHIMAYPAPTILLVEFTDHVYCVAIDTEWKESSRRWGGLDCKLIQLLPQYRVMQAGADMVYYNVTDRTQVKGIQFGKDARTTFLSVDDELHNVRHYGVDVRLQRLEVWGCGGPDALEAQKNHQQWENKEANKAKNRKLKIDVEEWKDSPDKQILEMGGVKTEHAER